MRGKRHQSLLLTFVSNSVFPYLSMYQPLPVFVPKQISIFRASCIQDSLTTPVDFREGGMGEAANVDSRVSPIQARGFIRHIAGTWNVSVKKYQLVTCSDEKSDLHVHCIELIPCIMVVHAVLMSGRTARCHHSPSGSCCHLTMMPSQSCLCPRPVSMPS